MVKLLPCEMLICAAVRTYVPWQKVSGRCNRIHQLTMPPQGKWIGGSEWAEKLKWRSDGMIFKCS